MKHESRVTNEEAIKRCTDCGGIHYGSVECPYYRSEPCIACNKILAHGETRKFDMFGHAYHPGCKAAGE